MGVLLYEMFTGRVPFDDDNTARLVRRIVRETAPLVGTLRPDLPPELAGILDRAIAKDPEARFSDAAALADALVGFEGQVLDRVLAEVSVTRAKMVKLMVILEANKSLAATLDPTETLKIILKTATSETDAERGTIFLKDPQTDELVSQVLEGGAVAPIRLPAGRGIAGTVARTGEIVNVGDAYNDRRFDSHTDADSGFRTNSIVAAPLRTPAGEIVGVVEILNKRRGGSFTKEDEEFLAEVGTHAALAVAGVRQHEAAVEAARKEGAARALKGAAALLVPHAWPDSPGFDAAPLRWRTSDLSLAAFAVEAGADRLAFLLLEPEGEPEDSLASLLKGLEAGRRVLAAGPAEEVVSTAAALAPGCAVSAAVWEGTRISLATNGAPLPAVVRDGRPVLLPPGATAVDARAGDMLVLASGGLARLRSARAGAVPTSDDALSRFGRLAWEQPLSAAFARLVADWKREGVTTGDRDVLLLAARRP
jgi:putative methionine-R-sulfoxide reductase with GAF domain